MSRPKVMLKMAECMLDHEPTDKETRDIYVLGWVMELLQFGILTSDDLVDQDQWRRGRYAWHCQPGVGLGAVFDSFVGIFLALGFLKKHLGDHPGYVAMVECIHAELLHVQLFQSWDHMVASHGPGNTSTFCEHKLRDISLGISGYYYIPVALMLHYLGADGRENLDASRAVTDELAVYYQSQNDYLDLYGSRAQNGKGGRDIRENKCSWLIVEGLSRASADQRRVLEASYGRKDDGSVEKVKAVFEELDMPGAFKSWQATAMTNIESQIASVDESRGLRREAFTFFLSLLVLV